MRLCLIVENGKAKGTQVEIPDDGEVVVGRDPGAGLRVPDTMVSRHHFKIALGPDGCFVQDLGSQNGTFVNDMRLQRETSIHVGDMVHAGETTFSLLELENKGLVGKEIAGHRILERVGRGGMGTVFRAKQLSLNREVALKVLSSRLIEDETFVQLFLKEARAAGALNHPNIVQVYDVGKNQGLYYFSMEFMACGSVQDRLNKEGKLPWAESVRVILEAARGLQYAHRKAVVHRDIKPDNLMIAEDDTVKIADLGLAHRADDTAAAGGEGILGTPHFISPEQALGKPVDVRSDIYSLGGTFFRMVAGQNPFSGRQVKEIILAQIREKAPAVHEVDPTIPRNVSGIIQRMMEKSPDDRYQNPGELIEDLERIWDNGNGALRTSSGLKKFALGAGAGLAVLVILFLIFSSRGKTPAPNPNPDQAGNGNQTAAPLAGTSAPTPPPPTGPDPAAIQKEREMKAQVAFLQVQSDRQLDEKNRMTRFRTVAEKHAGTEFGARAAAAADLISRKFEARAEQAQKKQQALRDAWARTGTQAATLIDDLRFSQAEALLRSFLKDNPSVAGLDLKPEVIRTQEELREKARKKYQALKEQADLKARANRLAEAAAVFAEFARKVADHPRPDEVFVQMAEQARKEMASHRTALQNMLVARFRADRKQLISSYRTAHEKAQEYDFSAALSVLETANKTIQNDSYRKRLHVGISAFQHMRDLKKTFIDRAGKKQGIKNTRIPLDTQMVRQDTGYLQGADEEFIHVQVSIQGQKTTFKRPWNGYPPAKFLQLFTEDRWDFSPEEMKSVAFLAAELGHYNEALDFANRSQDAGLIAWIKHELEAHQAYQEALRFRDAESWAGLLKQATTLKQDYVDTLFFLRHTEGEIPLADESMPVKGASRGAR